MIGKPLTNGKSSSDSPSRDRSAQLPRYRMIRGAGGRGRRQGGSPPHAHTAGANGVLPCGRAGAGHLLLRGFGAGKEREAKRKKGEKSSEPPQPPPGRAGGSFSHFAHSHCPRPSPRERLRRCPGGAGGAAAAAPGTGGGRGSAARGRSAAAGGAAGRTARADRSVGGSRTRGAGAAPAAAAGARGGGGGSAPPRRPRLPLPRCGGADWEPGPFSGRGAAGCGQGAADGGIQAGVPRQRAPALTRK